MIRLGFGAGRFAALAVTLALAACPGDDPVTTADTTGGDTVGADTAEQDTAGCTAGTAGCACRAGGGCDAPLVCSSELCVPAGACTGALGCACGDGCDDGLTCQSDQCTVAQGVLLTVSGGDARACDIQVVATGARAVRVVYAPGVRGHMWSRDAEIAVALMRTADEALTGVIGAVVLDGAPTGTPTVTATCYDRSGALDAAAAVTLQ